MTPAPLRHLLFALVWGMASLHAEEPYTIAVLISSQKGSISDTVESIRHFTEKQVREWNRQEQGLSGRKVKLLFLDDYEQGDQTKLNVREALGDENLIGFLGLWSSSRGAGVTEMIGQSGVPFISEMSLDSLFADYPTIYTLTTSVSDDTRCFQRFLRDHFEDTLFVGVTGDLFTQAFHTALTDLSDEVALPSEHWIKPQEDIPPGKLQSIIADIRKQQPQVLTLGVGSYRGGIVLKALAEANIKVPVFFATGSIPRMLRNMEGVNYEGPLYELGRSIPHVENERLAALRRGGNVTEKEAQFSNDDLAYGLTYRDMLAMMLEAAAASEESTPIALRQQMVRGLSELRAGEQVYHGLWRNWSFTEDRAVDQRLIIQWRPQGESSLKLWPVQSQVTASSGETNLPVVYLNLDMERIRSINSTEKTFEADFYVSFVTDQGIGLESFEFTNAFRSLSNGAPVLRSREIFRQTTPSVLGTQTTQRLYKVSGRFYFSPELRKYPFDSQRFSISFQPINTATPFLIQPPQPSFRDREFEMDGWTLTTDESASYVGSDEDVISLTEDYGSKKRILSFYKFNYTWTGKRKAVDYYLRVVIPLALIIVVAYYSVLIPNAKFQSVVSIQVTALLSTIALYLAIPKLDSETATLSDQIFLFTEAMIGLMIIISILRVNAVERNHPRLARAIIVIQIALFPLMTLWMYRYVVSGGY